MKHFYPYNLMMPRRKNSDMAKGGFLLGCILLVILGMFIMAPDNNAAQHAQSQQEFCMAHQELPQCIARNYASLLAQ